MEEEEKRNFLGRLIREAMFGAFLRTIGKQEMDGGEVVLKKGVGMRRRLGRTRNEQFKEVEKWKFD